MQLLLATVFVFLSSGHELVATELEWPITNPAETTMCAAFQSYDSGFDGNRDGVSDDVQIYMEGYNCQHANPHELQNCHNFEWVNVTPDLDRFTYWTWTWASTVIDSLGYRLYFRPFSAWGTLRDWDNGNFDPEFKVTFRNRIDEIQLHLNQNGNVVIGDSAHPAYDLNIQGLGQLWLGGASGGVLIFEGPTDDAFETKLIALNPQQDNVLFLPDRSGKVSIAENSPSAGPAYWGDPNDASRDTGSEVCGGTGLGCKTVWGPGGVLAACWEAQSSLFLALCQGG